jgi:transposase InsO family protein
MRLHPNAKTTPKARALIVQRVVQDGWTVAETAEAFGVSERTVHKWRAREAALGAAGMAEGSSRPRSSPAATPARRVAAVLRLRAQRWTVAAIARRLGMARSTVGAVVQRHGLGRLPPLEAPPPVRRYERAAPGELVHVDIKPLGKIGQVGHRIHGDRRRRTPGIGWEYVHVCVDDATRVAYVEVLAGATQADAVGFVERAVRWFWQQGVPIARVMTDNGGAYLSRAFNAACQRLQLRHLRTRPYTPRTNGKAERFIQTLIREWAYVRAYPSSAVRRRALGRYVRHYNRRRPHTSLNFTTPLMRLQELAA